MRFSLEKCYIISKSGDTFLAYSEWEDVERYWDYKEGKERLEELIKKYPKCKFKIERRKVWVVNE